jgi:hypothetical protein
MKGKWLELYAIVPKVILVILFFFWLGGIYIFKGPFEVNTYNSKLDTILRPPEYGGPKFEDWQQRKILAQKEIDVINQEAKAQGTNYNVVSYFTDLNRLMDLEDKYHLNLTTGMGNAVENLHGYFYKMPPNTDIPNSQKDFVNQVQERFGKRTGTEKCGPINWSVVLTPIFNWLVLAYLKLIFFWFLIYLIRFEEDDKYQGLSIKDELIICPSRFLLRILLWPRWCFAYPYHEDTAEAIRYLKLKARFLQNKTFGYQLSENEETWLRQQARASIEEFGKALKSLREFNASQLLKKSLAAAYLSLFFGVLLQPAIVLASKYSEKVNDHFYSPVQIVSVSHAEQSLFSPTGTGPPNFNSHGQQFAIFPPLPDLQPMFNWVRVNYRELIIKFPRIVFKIEHVPLAWLFLGAAKVFQPLTV